MGREVTEYSLQKCLQKNLEQPPHFPLFIFVSFYLLFTPARLVSACELCRLGMLLESLPWNVSLSQVGYAELGQLSSEQELPSGLQGMPLSTLHWHVPRTNTIPPANLWGVIFYSPQWSFFHWNCSLWVVWKTIFWLWKSFTVSMDFSISISVTRNHLTL